MCNAMRMSAETMLAHRAYNDVLKRYMYILKPRAILLMAGAKYIAWPVNCVSFYSCFAGG